MKSVPWLVLLSFLLSSLAGAQSSPASSAPNPGDSTSGSTVANVTPLTNGTVLSTELSKSLDAKKARANDRIEAKTTMDVLSHGQIIVPRNCKVIGRVIEAKAHSKQSPGSMLRIAFDRLLMKDGREVPLQAAVQAIGRPLQSEFGAATYSGGNDPYNPNSSGMPSASRGNAGQVPSVTGPSPYPSGHPERGGLESTPDPLTISGATVAPLDPTSQGVVGMKGLSLNGSAPVSAISSDSSNVHLDGGTQLILRVQ